jgi:hypothetical protein
MFSMLTARAFESNALELVAGTRTRQEVRVVTRSGSSTRSQAPANCSSSLIGKGRIWQVRPPPTDGMVVEGETVEATAAAAACRMYGSCQSHEESNSDPFDRASLASRIIVAPGGGGAARNSECRGGDGGAEEGETPPSGGLVHGAGGTQTAGGCA